MVRALLLGSGGMLAHDLRTSTPEGVELVAPAEHDLDITNEGHLERAMRDVRPDVVINAAAYTNVDRAESETDAAFRLNAEAVGLIGRVVASALSGQRSALVVHYSTDYVFSGASQTPYQETDAPDPLGAYGASKLAGERALAESGAEYLIIRTQWLFGLHGKSFPRTMWERAGGRLPTKVVNDQVGRPTYTVDLARATWELVAGSGKREAGSGILHVANAGTATWYDVARRVFDASGATELLSPCSTADYPTPAKRPAWSMLDTSRAESLLGRPLPRWEDALDRFLNGLKMESSAQRTAHGNQ